MFTPPLFLSFSFSLSLSLSLLPPLLISPLVALSPARPRNDDSNEVPTGAIIGGVVGMSLFHLMPLNILSSRLYLAQHICRSVVHTMVQTYTMTGDRKEKRRANLPPPLP